MTDLSQLAKSLTAANCLHFEDHTPCPSGYLGWHDWAAKMSKTHKQRKCAGCGLYAIWEPRRAHLKGQSDAA